MLASKASGSVKQNTSPSASSDTRRERANQIAVTVPPKNPPKEDSPG
jgi:hypothetical protein